MIHLHLGYNKKTKIEYYSNRYWVNIPGFWTFFVVLPYYQKNYKENQEIISPTHITKTDNIRSQ